MRPGPGPWARRVLVVLALALTGLGCGQGKGGGVVEYYGHYHPAGWMAEHPGKALANLANCTTCHEMTVLRAGSGVPTCMTTGCHHGTVPGWANPDRHGLQAKRAAGPGGGSLGSCQLCHGKDFAGGGAANACASCHGVAAPHPARPWRLAGAGTLTHATTDPSNAPACAACHFPGSPHNPAGHPAAPAAAGTQPGCYNATLCHGEAGAPHALGPVWTDATSAAFHGLEAKKDLGACQSCHGAPGTPRFDGGSAATACSACHTAGKAHPTTWYQAPVQTFPGYTPSHRNAGNLGACDLCHDGLTKGRTAPLPAAPSCYASSYDNGAHGAVGCHANGPAAPNHPIPFVDTNHLTVTQAQFTANCASCHAVSGTSPVGAAPPCATCHTAASPLASGSGTGTCLSCHAGPAGLPAGPTGTAFPSIAGAHAKHMALAGVTCAACHNGIGAGSLAHYAAANARVTAPASPAPVAFTAAFNAKTGAASFSPTALTCAATSCHGGVTAPNWQTGSLNAGSVATSNTYCLSCHTSGTLQYNGYFSGEHNKHAPAYCADCHSMLSGAGQAGHWGTLATPAMEGPASATIQFSAAATGSRTYNPTNRSCTLSCHFPNSGSNKGHNPETW